MVSACSITSKIQDDALISVAQATHLFRVPCCVMQMRSSADQKKNINKYAINAFIVCFTGKC